MRVLVAFDKFKDSMSAHSACAAAAGAVARDHPGWSTDACPLTDGGEGFAEILTRAAGGATVALDVSGPRGGRVGAALGLVSMDHIPIPGRALLVAAGAREGGRVGVVDMASASGLALLAPWLRDPLLATSAGTGELLAAAARSGVDTILLGVGGSATHDLGLGALGALGLRFLGDGGADLGSLVPAAWPGLRRITGSLTLALPPVLIACDVDNPLLGPRGALTVYGPQKGLDPAGAEGLERETARVASLMLDHFGKPAALVDRPGAGAAGGTAFGLMAGLGASLVPGFRLVSSWLDLDRRLDAADLVLTGEGRFDESSLSGKGPGAVARRALERGRRVHVFAGEVALRREIPGISVHPVTPGGMALPEALRQAPALLAEAVRRALRER
jgi:glycerate kinase